jgi:hypothetical protein
MFEQYANHATERDMERLENAAIDAFSKILSQSHKSKASA